MSGIHLDSGNLKSDGTPYHEHVNKVEKNKDAPNHHHHEPKEHYHQEPKEHIPHGHNNQFHKDIKGSGGSGSSEQGDRKVEKESK